ncbi:MAG: Hsp20/alpha crystallin family protein [Planctomycetes bacterium]|nr:Hsp20/alpha crystallin family protein [Planctomycetota bacterium]
MTIPSLNTLTIRGEGPSAPTMGSIDRVFSDFFGDGHNYGRQTRGLSYEIDSDEYAVYAKVDVPGVDPKDISVRVEGRAIHVETPRGNAYFTVGARVDGDSSTASVKHGLLTLTVPKRQAKTVAVTVEDLG